MASSDLRARVGELCAVLVAVALVGGVGGCGTSGGTDRSAMRSSQSTTPPTTLLVDGHGTMPTPDAASLSDLRKIAASQGITLHRAITEYAWQNQFGIVAGQLAERYPHLYASARINPPGFVGGVVRLAGRPPEAALRLLATLPVPSRVETHQTYTARQVGAFLRSANDAVTRGLSHVNRSWSTYFDDDNETFTIEIGTRHGYDPATVTAAVVSAVHRRFPRIPTLPVRFVVRPRYSISADDASSD